MSVRNLEQLFDPQSVAVIGASDRLKSVGATVLHNLLAAPFRGPVYAVNPKHRALAGRQCYPDVAALPGTPDLAVICTPAATVPRLVAQLGARGTRAAVVLSTGFSAPAADGASLRQAALDAARPWLLRILGPSSMGVLAPGIGLNASFAHLDALPGRTAFVSQSGALVSGVLDWARARGIGFSRFISLGEGADVDFGDVLDYLAMDNATQAILLYMHEVHDVRKFMSAARAASRSKPTVVLKAGRAADAHGGVLAGTDAAYDAAIRRAGMLRVRTTEDLFGVVETLARARRLDGERLAILTNGGGPGVMATDELLCGGGTLAELSGDTLARLAAILPASWPHANPVDIDGDAPVERYRGALEALLQAPEADAVLLLHAPTASVDSGAIAHALVPVAKGTRKNVIGCWLGGDGVQEARRAWAGGALPAYDTPEEAVQAFLHMVQYRRNQRLLMQVPPATPPDPATARHAARAIVGQALSEQRARLTEPEAKALLAAYGIPVVPTRQVGSVPEAVAAAGEMGFPVALKIVSPDVIHKTEVGGVALDLADAAAVEAAAHAMAARLAELRPAARLRGYAVQPMARRVDATELIVGAATDPTFGPVILFGQGGVGAAALADSALALPPLNMVLARDLVQRTRIGPLLAGYRGRPPADIEAVCDVLVRVAHLVTDLAEVADIDINPLLADGAGVIALDASARVMPASRGALERLAIRPYPDELEETVDWEGQPLLLRPIRPEDAPAHTAFFAALTPEDVRLRMFVRMRELQPAQLARFTQVDYDREMAFIATRTGADGQPETLGVVRAVADPDNVEAEFAVTVRSDLKGKGLGRLLMNKLIRYCRARGTAELVGDALDENKGILGMTRKLGFRHQREPGDDTVRMTLPLQGDPAGATPT
jgi:acetyltransferase